MIYISYQLQILKKQNVIKIRDYKHFNKERFLYDLDHKDFGLIYATNDTDLQVEHFTYTLLNLYDKHVPEKTISINKTDPWMKYANVKLAKNLRIITFRAYTENKCIERWRTYCVYRNRLKKTIRKERDKYYKTVLSCSSPKTMWSKFREVGLVEAVNIDCNVNVNECNDLYILPPIDNAPSVLYHQNVIENYIGFSFSNVEEYEVFNSVMGIKSEAVGPDGLSLKFLKIVLLR